MPVSNSQMVYKLQKALNSKNLMILNNRKQFFSTAQNRPVTMYSICQCHFEESTGRTKSQEIFSTFSEIQVVLFLRNLWYYVNGNSIPKTNSIKGAEKFERSWSEFIEGLPEDNIINQMHLAELSNK